MTSFLTRYRRRLVAGCAVVLLAFAHAAIAVSGCMVGTMPATKADCEEHGQSTPNNILCSTHLQAETQTLDLAKLPQIFPFDAPVLALAPVRSVAAAEIGVAIPAPIAFAGAPPPLNVLYSRSLT